MSEHWRALYERAISLLAQREQSRAELRRRLGGMEGADQLLEPLLAELAEQGVQSDERYAEGLLRGLLARGQGPVRIRQTLRQKGVDQSQVDALMGDLGLDWYERACEVQRKRFGTGPGRDPKLRAKQIRFLLYRGFEQDQAYHALGMADQDQDA